MNNYSWLVSSVQHVSQGLDFFGFSADSGEVFSSFSLTAALDAGSAPAIDNVTLGSRAFEEPDIVQVSEPSSIALLLMSFSGLLMFRHKGLK